jgi:hypothetical protein
MATSLSTFSNVIPCPVDWGQNWVLFRLPHIFPRIPQLFFAAEQFSVGFDVTVRDKFGRVIRSFPLSIYGYVFSSPDQPDLPPDQQRVLKSIMEARTEFLQFDSNWTIAPSRAGSGSVGEVYVDLLLTCEQKPLKQTIR